MHPDSYSLEYGANKKAGPCNRRGLSVVVQYVGEIRALDKPLWLTGALPETHAKHFVKWLVGGGLDLTLGLVEDEALTFWLGRFKAP